MTGRWSSAGPLRARDRAAAPRSNVAFV